jgi:hypothetical protein
MSYHLDPDNDRNEAYALIPMPAELRGTSGYWTGWWTMTRNGVPVRTIRPRTAISPSALRAQLVALAVVARQLRKPAIAAMLRKARDGSEAYNAMLSS